MGTGFDVGTLRGHDDRKQYKLRWCTSYFKARACDVWLRENRDTLGDRPLLLSGERHAESPSRSKLPHAEWRFGTKGWDVLWYRPVIDWPWHQVVQASRSTSAISFRAKPSQP